MSVPRPRHRPNRHEKPTLRGSAAGLGPQLEQQTGLRTRLATARLTGHDRRGRVPRARHREIAHDRWKTNRAGVSALIAVGSIASGRLRGAAQDFYRQQASPPDRRPPFGNDHDVADAARRYPAAHSGRPSVIAQNMTRSERRPANMSTDKRRATDRHGYVLTQFPQSGPRWSAQRRGRPAPFPVAGATSFPGRVCTAWVDGRSERRPPTCSTSELIVGGSRRRLDAELVPTVLNSCTRDEIPHRRGNKAAQECAAGHRAR